VVISLELFARHRINYERLLTKNDDQCIKKAINVYNGNGSKWEIIYLMVEKEAIFQLDHW